MPEGIKGKGYCLCGVVQVVVETMSCKVGACHCNTCRKWCGAPFVAADCSTEVSFVGEENITVFDSSEWAERGFCKTASRIYFIV